MIRIGTDIIEISRVQRSLSNPRFVARVFSYKEQELFSKRNSNTFSYAGNFCAKEAFAKAFGTGIRGFSLNEISVLRDPLGAPYYEFSENLQALIDRNDLYFVVSISHCKEYAVATAIGLAKQEKYQ